MTAFFALNFILQLCFALVCLSLLYPFSPAAGLNFTPPRAVYLSALGTPRVRDAALMRQYDSNAAHSGIDSPSTDWICALCGRHSHFNAPKMR